MDHVDGVVFDRVSHGEHTHNLVVSANEDRRTALLFQFRGRRSEVVGQKQIVLVDELEPSHQHGPAVDLGAYPATLVNAVAVGIFNPHSSAAATIAAAIGCSRPDSTAAASRSTRFGWRRLPTITSVSCIWAA
jgi:hypothetical protein